MQEQREVRIINLQDVLNARTKIVELHGSTDETDREYVARLDRVATQYEKACCGEAAPDPARMIKYCLGYVKNGTLEDIAASTRISLGDLEVILRYHRYPTVEEARILGQYFDVPAGAFIGD